MGEALLAYEARLKEKAYQNYLMNYLAWNIRAAAGSREKAPKMPEILND